MYVLNNTSIRNKYCKSNRYRAGFSDGFDCFVYKRGEAGRAGQLDVWRHGVVCLVHLAEAVTYTRRWDEWEHSAVTGLGVSKSK